VFALAWEYLAGVAVATDPTDRQQPEWPPHPDRVFQALVAAWGELGAAPDHVPALRWLEQLPPPELCASNPAVLQRKTVKTYVPANDLEGSTRSREYGDPLLGLLPEARPRKERFFPATIVGDGAFALAWPEAVPPPDVLDFLRTLSAEVTHIGHSSSMVRMWITDAPPPVFLCPAGEGQSGETHLRVPEAGRLDALEAAFAGGGEGWRRPPMAMFCAYRSPEAPAAVAQSLFDPNLIMLRRCGGDPLGLESTLALTQALRGTLLKQAPGEAGRLIAGHAPDGGPSEAVHLAILPLPFVGHEHADGHLLGLALALPRGLDRPSQDECLKALAQALDPDSYTLKLVCGTVGETLLTPEERSAPPLALRPSTWTHRSRIWASVTPIVLDRFAPRRHRDQDAEARAAIGLACERIGLPQPVRIHLLPVSRFTGAPAARSFPAILRKSDGVARWHIHAELEFPVEVEGPVLLGAGRFRGYGLCRPWKEGKP